ncbi:MAG: hypothetical protein GY869_30840, partial [Planctomycetes bacterium]|nr:hypothetical protein [Planctomycetota bacterium]
MYKNMLLCLLIIFLLFSVAAASPQVKPDLPSHTILLEERPTSSMDMPVVYINNDDPPGINDSPGEIVGTTMYDYQHNSSLGHQIAVTEDGKVHVVWMHSDNEQHEPRRVKYRYRDLAGNWGSISNVDPGPRAGYTVIDLHSDGAAVAAYHLGYMNDAESQVAKDLIEGFGSFIQTFIDDNSVPTEQISWPKIAIGPDDICHAIASNWVDGNNNMYYSRSNSGNYDGD